MGWGRGTMPPSTFSEIVLCQEPFRGNSLLCHSQRHPKFFWPRHSPNLVGGPTFGVSDFRNLPKLPQIKATFNFHAFNLCDSFLWIQNLNHRIFSTPTCKPYIIDQFRRLFVLILPMIPVL